ncbi:MAG: penicillin-binding protein 2, partial [Candidatus Thioglobus sp.]|nr:penicillin-binding protein 2 [Candidatus Thioglobus sp.]
ANIEALKIKKIRICREKLVKNKLNLWQKTLILASIKPEQKSHKKITKCRREVVQGVALQEDSLRYYPKSAALAPLLGRVNNHKKGISGIEGEFEAILKGQNGNSQLNFNANSHGSYFNPVSKKPLKHGQDIVLTIDANIQFYAYSHQAIY